MKSFFACRFFPFFCAALLLILPSKGYSNEALHSETMILPPVTVVGAPADPLEDPVSTLSGATIEALPLKSSQGNEALKFLPHVQVGDSTSLSTQEGEIFPPELSISGGRTYRNNFLVDGFGTNDFVDPGGNYFPKVPDQLPTTSFNSFLDSSFIETLTVYDSNISAEYGGFTGGVVVSNTRSPDPDFGGRVYYRTTKDSWTSFHISVDQAEDFHEARSEKFQPRFHKEEAGIELNIPIGKRFGMLLGYSILHSDIPLRLLGEEKSQSRQIENYFFKGRYRWSELTEIQVSFLTTPFQGSFFLEDTKDSKYEITKGGMHFTGDVDHVFAFGRINVGAVYGESWAERNAREIFRSWKFTPTTNWGEGYDLRSREGGFGNLEKRQRDIQLKAKVGYDPFWLLGTENILRAGINLQQVDGEYVRDKDAINFTVAETDDLPISCQDDVNCIPDEQYLKKRIIFKRFQADARLRIARLWIEDQIRFKRLSLRPGLHVSYDDLMENLNLGPRLAGFLDVFGTGGTVFNVGYNRYYASPLLTYALREKFPAKITDERKLEDGYLSPWESSFSTLTSQFGQLETPYSDEWTAGLDQSLGGGRLSLKYINRKGRDELAKDMVDGEVSGTKNWILNNSGRSIYEGYSMAWKRKGKFLSWGSNITYIAKNSTSNSNYEAFFDEERALQRVWYEGKAISESELPRGEYNREWTGNLFVIAHLPYNFSFSNVTRYRSGYSRIDKAKEDPILYQGEELDVYEKVDHPESWIFDWKLAWTTPSVHGNTLTLTAEVLNVFNRKILAGEADDEYEIGRQLWAGAEWRF